MPALLSCDNDLNRILISNLYVSWSVYFFSSRLSSHATRPTPSASRLTPSASRLTHLRIHLSLSHVVLANTHRLFQSHSLHSYFTLSRNFSHNFKCFLVSMQIFNFLAVFHLSNILHRKKSIEKKRIKFSDNFLKCLEYNCDHLDILLKTEMIRIQFEGGKNPQLINNWNRSFATALKVIKKMKISHHSIHTMLNYTVKSCSGELKSRFFFKLVYFYFKVISTMCFYAAIAICVL